MNKPNLRLKILIFTGIILAGTAALFGSKIRTELVLRLVLNRTAPSEEVVWSLIEDAPRADQVLWRLWHSNKIPLRVITLGYIKFNVPDNSTIYTAVESLVIEAARDPDMSARELSLAVLSAHQSTNLPAMAMAQLKDADPHVRMLGLRYLKRANQPSVHAIARLLEDPELQVAATAATVLRRWTGQNFGVQVGLSVPD